MALGAQAAAVFARLRFRPCHRRRWESEEICRVDMTRQDRAEGQLRRGSVDAGRREELGHGEEQRD